METWYKYQECEHLPQICWLIAKKQTTTKEKTLFEVKYYTVRPLGINRYQKIRHCIPTCELLEKLSGAKTYTYSAEIYKVWGGYHQVMVAHLSNLQL